MPFLVIVFPNGICVFSFMLIELISCPRRLIEDDMCVVISVHTANMTVRAVVRLYEELILLGCQLGYVTCASIITVYYCLGIFHRSEMAF